MYTVCKSNYPYNDFVFLNMNNVSKPSYFVYDKNLVSLSIIGNIDWIFSIMKNNKNN